MIDLNRLQPRTGQVFVVRYVSGLRGDVKQRYYSRRHDAVNHAAKMRSKGARPQIFVASTDWSRA